MVKKSPELATLPLPKGGSLTIPEGFFLEHDPRLNPVVVMRDLPEGKFSIEIKLTKTPPTDEPDRQVKIRQDSLGLYNFEVHI